MMLAIAGPPRACGRSLTTKRGKCTKPPWRIYIGFDAIPVVGGCKRHATAEERRFVEAFDRAREQRFRRAGAHRPAFWSWPKPSDDVPEWLSATWLRDCKWEKLYGWHQGRCAVCGVENRTLVEDHDHETGWIRGYLCRGCNTSEGMSGGYPEDAASRIRGERFARYRRWFPAKALGVWRRYYDPIAGEYDRGRLYRSTTRRPLVVTGEGETIVPALMQRSDSGWVYNTELASEDPFKNNALKGIGL